MLSCYMWLCLYGDTRLSELLLQESNVTAINYNRIGNTYNTPSLVDSVLKELTLTKCADTKVAKISGGKLKQCCAEEIQLILLQAFGFSYSGTNLTRTPRRCWLRLIKKNTRNDDRARTDSYWNIFKMDPMKKGAIMAHLLD